MTSTHIKVLAVDDEPDLCSLTKQFLEMSGNIQVDTAGSVREAMSMLASKRYGAIVSDYQMPEEDGIQFLKSLRAAGERTPFILFTGKGREEVVIEALNNGADAYLQKGGGAVPQYTELGHRIHGLVQRSQAEKALHDSEERFNQVANNADEWIWEVDSKGLIIYSNSVVERIIGYKPEELVDKVHFFDLKPIEDREHIKQSALAAFKDKLPIRAFINRSLTKSGEIVLLETSGIPFEDETGRMIGYRGTNKDITARKRTDELLRQNNEELNSVNQQMVAAEEELRQQLDEIIQGHEELGKEMAFSESLMESLPGIFYLYDAQTLRLVRWNRNHQEVSGYSREEMFGKHVLEWHRPENADAVLAAIKNIMSKGRDSIETSLVMKDGREIHYLLTGERFDTKERSFFMGVGIDITERKRAEAALIVANRKLNLLSSITRHDINNQTAAITGHLALLKMKHPELECDEHVRTIEREAGQISSMIRFTKEYENIGVNAPIWHDITKLVGQSHNGMLHSCTKVVDDIPTGTTVYADPLITKVFHNLIQNALRHSKNATAIRFYLEDRDGGKAIVCEDNGVGISADMKKVLFTKGIDKDHGFGLFLTKEILAITGITITEEGELGKGAKFVMLVPSGGIREGRAG